MLLLLIASGLLVAALVVPLLGWHRSLFAAVLITLTVASVPLIAFGDSNGPYIIGVAPPIPTITTATVALLLALVWSATQGVPGRAWWPLVPIIMFVIFGAIFIWPPSATLSSGVLHVLMACVAWYVGVGMSGFAHGDSKYSLFVAGLALLIALTLSVPSWVQWWQGVGVEGFGDRTGGLFAHPSTAGKVAMVLVCLLLPLSESRNQRTRRVALAAMLIAASAALPTLSRANILAIVLVVLGWLALNMKRIGFSRFFGTVVVLGLVALPFVDNVIQRFVSDPEGTGRPMLTEAALRNIPDRLYTGTGPSNYVATLMNTDSTTAILGAPVHNIFLLVLAEVGVVGVMICIPIVITVAGAAVRLSLRGETVEYARALLLLLGGTAFIGLTGWGIMRAPVGQFVVFVAGVLWGLASALPQATQFTNANEDRFGILRGRSAIV